MKAVFPYLGFIGAVIVAVLFAFGIIPQNVAEVLIGLLGFSGFAGLRAYINSQGWKTYFIAAVGALSSVAYALGFMPQDVFVNILTIFGLLGGATLTHAVKKATEAGA